MRIERKKIEKMGIEVLKKYGMRTDDAQITLSILIETEAMGIHSHGLKNLNNYVEKIKNGSLNPIPDIKIIYENASSAVIDADNSIGMVSSLHGMNEAIKRAQKTGVGYCCVRNSCHFGAGGVYANYAAKQGMFAMAMSNTDPNMAIPGGVGMVIGNNPFAYAYPKRNGDTVFLDIALSSTAALKINKAKAEHKPIPDTWLIDSAGNPTTDPQWYGNGGALQPVGMHKGYGLSIMVEVLTAIMAGGSICRDVPSWCFKLDEKNRACHGFLAIDIGKLCGIEAFYDSTEEFENYIKSSKKRNPDTEIFMPGEKEWYLYHQNSEILYIPEDVLAELRKLIPEIE